MTACLDRQTGDVLVKFPYDPDTVRAVKELPGRRWNPMKGAWACRMCAPLFEFLVTRRVALSPDLEDAIRSREISLQSSRADHSDFRPPCPGGLEYLDFQRAGIAWIVDHPRCLMADEMGLGKTVQVLGAINSLPAVTSVLVICPATLRHNWWREAMRWLIRRRHPIEMVTMKRSSVVDFVIAHYDIFSRESVAAKALLARRWDMLILDESHALKNSSARRTKNILGTWDSVRRQNVGGIVAERVVALTGTPILNKPVEIWTIAHALAPWEFPHFGPFAKRYCGLTQDEWGTHYDGADNLDELQERLRGVCMIRRRKSEVLDELPAKRRQVIELDAEGAMEVIAKERRLVAVRESWFREMHRTVAEARERRDKEDYAAAVAALRRGVVVTFGEIASLRRQTAMAKLPHVIAHVTGLLEENEKIVLWVHHHDVVAGLREAFGGVAVTITGETPMADRQQIVDRFQTDASVKLFIGSIKVGGLGINLTAASLVIFAELSWTPADLSQCEDRCHRIGQENAVLIQHLVFAGSLDAIMAHRLVAKQDILDAMLDDLDEAALPVLPIGDEDSFNEKETIHE